MAFIYNIRSGLSHECTNADVIKVCKKDNDSFIVKDTVEGLEKAVKIHLADADDNQGGNGGGGETKPLADLTVPELKEIAKEKNIEGYSNLNKAELIAVIEQAG